MKEISKIQLVNILNKVNIFQINSKRLLRHEIMNYQYNNQSDFIFAQISAGD